MTYRALLFSLKEKCPMIREYVDVDYWKKLNTVEKEWLSKALVELYTGAGSNQDKRRHQFDFRAVRSSIEDLGDAI